MVLRYFLVCKDVGKQKWEKEVSDLGFDVPQAHYYLDRAGIKSTSNQICVEFRGYIKDKRNQSIIFDGEKLVIDFTKQKKKKQR